MSSAPAGRRGTSACARSSDEPAAVSATVRTLLRVIRILQNGGPHLTSRIAALHSAAAFSHNRDVMFSPILAVDQEKVERDVAFLMDCFSEVLDEAGERELAACLPWRSRGCAPSSDTPRERLL